MKKILAVLVAGLMVLAASPLMAANLLGPHDDGSGNPCRLCHNTASGSPALRGWAGTTGTFSNWGAVSNLCYMCHDSAGSYSANGMVDYAYTSGHAAVKTAIPRPPDGPRTAPQRDEMDASGLPYTIDPGGNIECTTCHNVHVVSVRPFNQRDSFQLLCEQCHVGRSGADFRNIATTNARPGGTYSTHPINASAADSGNATTGLNFLATIRPEMNITIDEHWSSTDTEYVLGGKMNFTTGTIGCQTCHAVHGHNYNAVQITGTNELLALDNDNQANDTGASELCEGCHQGGSVGADGTTGTDDNEGVGQPGYVYGGTEYEGTDSDHPIDGRNGRTSFYPYTVSLPTAWNNASNVNGDRGTETFWDRGGAGGAAPVCSNCHDTHGGIGNSPILRGPLAGGYPDWSTSGVDYATWCFVCHPDGGLVPNSHHSVAQNMNATDHEFDSQLECGDCHGAGDGAGWTAHNGFWGWVVAPNANDSELCIRCHNVADPRNFVGSLKTRAVALVGDQAAGATFPATHGTLRGTSTHQTDATVGLGGTDNIIADPDWSFAGAEPERVSQWTTEGRPICESCHNILYNGVGGRKDLTSGWEANLLLAPYEDDLPGAGAGEGTDHDFYGDTTSGPNPTGVQFCRACHDNGSGFVHNPPAHTVNGFDYVAAGYATPYGRTGTSGMLTNPTSGCPDKSTADQTVAPSNSQAAPGGLSYPSVYDTAPMIDCDSCHRPHSADNESIDGTRYLILEITDENWGTTICAECHNTDTQCKN